ncbi:unnamed protein product, partial [Staurois parvus]
FLPLAPTKGHYSSQWHQWWGTISPIDSDDRALFFPLTPMIENYSSYYPNDGALFLPVTPTVGHYSSH